MDACETGSNGCEPAQMATEKSSPKARPYQCDQCKVTFRRVDHLKRHVKLHTDQYKYQCPCGDTFSRNDVLARHLLRCEKGKKEQELVVRHSSKQTRTKSACNRCAKLKLKCDSQDPCRLCSLGSHPCKYTRQGYSDPYNCFLVRRGSGLSGSSETALNWPGGDASLPMSDSSASVTLPTMDPSDSSISHDILDNNLNSISIHQLQNERIPSDNSATDLGISNGSALSDRNADFDSTSVFDYPFDAETLFAFPETMAFIDFGYTMAPQPSFGMGNGDPQTIAPRPPTGPRPTGGFSLQQIDPVEAKCFEIKQLFLSGEPLMAHDIISIYITRDNIIRCSELYGKHFQPNVPIIHRPTFDLIQTFPILLLAITLVGACYSEDLIPIEHITKLAMRLLARIEQQPHEIDMETPPLSTIQASVILRPLLILSRNEKANRFASLYFARIISMAERCGIFGPVDPIDYGMLTDRTFDWALWIEQETRRRVACQIFTQDMALCVFRRRSPYFSPLTLKAEMPCYESCWEAETASQCLERLQVLPGHIRVATAMKLIRSDSLEGAVLFEASAFAMTLLILGLHSVLFQATQTNLEPPSDTEKIGLTPDNQTSDSMSRLHQAFADNSVTTLADELVDRHGSATLRHINRSLDRWRTSWDLRNCQGFKQETITLSTDPLRYWWLAKLYLVLHFYGNAIHKDSEFAIVEAESGDEQGKLQEIQLKILSWLSRFRRQRGENLLSTKYYMARVVEPLNSGR